MNENLYPKSFSEKLGSFFSFGLIRFIFAILFLFLGPLGIAFDISMFRAPKLILKANLEVRTNSGEIIPFAIIEEKRYLLFKYLNFNTNYYLVKYMHSDRYAPGTPVLKGAIKNDFFKKERISKAKAFAVQQNPQILLPEIEATCNNDAREVFLREMKNFFENNLLNEVFYTAFYSVCEGVKYGYIFFYETQEAAPQGLLISKDMLNSMQEKRNINDIFDWALCKYRLAPAESFDNQLFENMVFKNNMEINNNLKETLNKINESKQPLTRLKIQQKLFEAEPIIIKSQIHKERESKILNGQYRIIRTVCTDYDIIFDNTVDGVDYYKYSTKTGEDLVIIEESFCRVGDPVYLVYLEGENKPGAYFNGVYYHPEPGLVIEDTINEKINAQKILLTRQEIETA